MDERVKGLTFDEWWTELQKVAAEKDLSFLLSPEKEDHKIGWTDGYSPQDELDEQIYAAGS
jgi:hypothetical protein